MSITLELSDDLVTSLRAEASAHGYTVEEWLSLQIRQKRAVAALIQLGKYLAPQVAASDWKTEEDVFRDVS